jgi:hypothetical protein
MQSWSGRTNTCNSRCILALLHSIIPHNQEARTKCESKFSDTVLRTRVSKSLVDSDTDYLFRTLILYLPYAGCFFTMARQFNSSTAIPCPLLRNLFLYPSPGCHYDTTMVNLQVPLFLTFTAPGQWIGVQGTLPIFVTVYISLTLRMGPPWLHLT